MDIIERKKLEAQLLRAKALIADYEVNRLEREQDIERINREIERQKNIIETITQKLGGENA